MKAEWELELRGYNICRICGASEPCGNILDCAWWTDDKPNRFEDRRIQGLLEQQDYYESIQMRKLELRISKIDNSYIIADVTNAEKIITRGNDCTESVYRDFTILNPERLNYKWSVTWTSEIY